MNAKRISMLQIVLCSVLWSTGGIFIKLIPWNAMVLSGCRSLIAAFVVLVYIRIIRLKLEFNKYTFGIAVCLCGTLLSFVLSTKLTTAASAIVLQYSAPVLILIYYAIFRKKRFTFLDYIVVLLTVFGIVLFFIDGLSGGNILGNIVGLMSGVFFSGVFIISGDVAESTRLNGIFQGQVLTALIGLPFIGLYDTPMTTQAILFIVVLGIFQLGLPYALYAAALKNCPPLTASLIAVIEPLLNPVWTFLFTGELPGVWAVVGGVIVLLSVTFWCAKDAMIKGSGAGKAIHHK